MAELACCLCNDMLAMSLQTWQKSFYPYRAMALHGGLPHPLFLKATASCYGHGLRSECSSGSRAISVSLRSNSRSTMCGVNVPLCSSRPPNAADTGSAEVLEAAWEILDNFNRNDIRGDRQPSLQSPDGLAALSASVLVAAEAAAVAEDVNPLISVCAKNAEEAVKSLQHWIAALGYPQINRLEDMSAVSGPVYLKYNVKSERCYLQAYQGDSRGVILQLGQRQVAHLPLFLFDKTHENM